MNELISIIVPIYNREKTLARCIQSVLQQTYQNFELILVNDGSFDGTGRICQQYLARDNRIIYVSQKNQGVGTARNVGIQRSNGKYMLFLDSDDALMENALEVLCKEAGKALVIGGLCKQENGKESTFLPVKERIKGRKLISNAITNRKKMYFINSLGGKIFSSEIIKDGRIEFLQKSYGEDTDFVYQYISKCLDVIFLDQIVYRYYATESSLSQRKIYDPWEKMVGLYERGSSQILRAKDYRNQYLLLSRSIRTSLLLAARVSRHEFKNTVMKIRVYLKRNHLTNFKGHISFYDDLVYRLVKNQGGESSLYAIFKIRCWIGDNIHH